MDEELIDIIRDPKFKYLSSLGLIDDIAVRNIKIKHEYGSLRKSNSVLDSIHLLSKKYCLAEATINSILFRKRTKKRLIV